jgi:hypothetical protein
MNRRRFVVGAALVLSLRDASRAQTAEKVYRLGIIAPARTSELLRSLLRSSSGYASSDGSTVRTSPSISGPAKVASRPKRSSRVSSAHPSTSSSSPDRSLG